MEIFCNSISYDNRWVFMKSIPIGFLYLLNYMITLINLSQIYLLYGYYTTSNKGLSLILSAGFTAFSHFLLNLKYKSITNIDFLFIKEAQIYDKDVSLKPFEILIRRKALESKSGIFTLICSVIKFLICFFIETESILAYYEKTNYEILAYFTLIMYRKFSCYSTLYQLLVVIWFSLVKGPMVLMYIYLDNATIKFFRLWNSFLNKEVKEKNSKSIGKLPYLNNFITSKLYDRDVYLNDMKYDKNGKLEMIKVSFI